MRTAWIKYSLAFWIMIAIRPGVLLAQPLPMAGCQESVVALTDRGLYISGEEILFSAIVVNQEKAQESLSQVLYVELITPEGVKVNTGKYRIEKGKASGCLHIPEDALSGNYYLKAYTRWMRNNGPSAYHYRMLRIVNPYREEVLAGQEFSGDSTDRIAGKYHETPNPGIRLDTDKSIYLTRERVRGTVEGMIGEGLLFCVSGMPSVALRDSISIPRDSIPASSQYLPETRGISVSGRMTESNTGQPLANARVNLSIIGDMDMLATLCDQNGQFYFALPDHYGTMDIFLSGEDSQGKTANILIDNDFCTLPVRLKAPVFHLTEQERGTVLKMAANQKVAEHFRVEDITKDTPLSQKSEPFYGRPDEILFLEKYIDLPTLEDYFHELVGSVGIRNHDGRKIFRFNTYKAEMNIYDPLVMIDWVVVDDLEKLLSVSPRGIERIELVNAPWLKGSITYGGIISFISKNKDFAGIDLPTSGTFVNYSFLSDCVIPEVNIPVKDQLPDARNTICWIPDLKPDGSGRASIEFYTPDTPGVYSLVIRGVSKHGDEIFVKKEIEVR